MPCPGSSKTPGFNSRTREGATSGNSKKQVMMVVSIHAPVRVRLRVPVFCRPVPGFNSRTREGATEYPPGLL